MGNEKLLVLPPIEITSTGKFYDYESKYTPGGSRHIIPARITPEVEQKVKAIAAKAYSETGCRGLSRVDMMLENGLLEEAERILRTDPDATVTQAIGYKEFAAYFDGTISLEEAADKLRQQTRRYAKRQLSWFHRMVDAHTLWVDDYNSADELLAAALRHYEDTLV